MKADKERRDKALAKKPPIPCAGRWYYSINGDDFDCEYPHAGEFGCEDCIVNGGPYDPRTGRRAKPKERQ